MSMTSSCSGSSSDWMGNYYGSGGSTPFTNPNINLIGANPGIHTISSAPYSNGYINLTPTTTCNSYNFNLTPSICGPSSTGNITLNKTPQQIKLTFNNYNDYDYYKDKILESYLNTNQSFNSPSTYLNFPVICDGTTNIDYYRYFQISIPFQGANANCGDNTTQIKYPYHFNDYFNIIYNESPSTNTWSITIPQTPMVNCYPQNLAACNTCHPSIDNFITEYNTQVNNFSTFTFTTNTGAKYLSPIGKKVLSQSSTQPVSGSKCYYSSTYNQFYPWYAITTVPFVSSSTGWVNLYSLQTSLPCSTSSYQHNKLIHQDIILFI
jgi:hypothetical protein